MRIVAGSAGTANSSINLYTGGATDPRILIDKDGNVGIGTTAPQDKLTVVGDINVSGCIEEDDGTLIGGTCVSDLSTKKNIQTYQTNLSKLLSLSPKEFEYKNVSILAGIKNKTIEEEYISEYKETEIFNEETNQTEIIQEPIYSKRNITVQEEVRYNLPEGTQKGFIADEVEQYYPEFVKTDEFGIKRIVYGVNWIFESWKFLQNHEERIRALEEENNDMKKSLCKLGEIKFC